MKHSYSSTAALIIAALGLSVVAVACLAENVGADSYARDCKQDSDCIPILELSVTDGKCTQPCAAINKKDEDKYKNDIEEERHDCESLAPAACGSGHTAACRDNKCVPLTAGGQSLADAGTD
jgi:hypothetical protein